jgi:hypothetical protein
VAGRRGSEQDLYYLGLPELKEDFYFVAGHQGAAPLIDSRSLPFRFKDQYIEFSTW